MSPELPARPSLEWLHKTAKDRLAEMREADPRAKLAQAQLAVAREHGFPSWRKLKAHVERLESWRQSPEREQLLARFLGQVGAGRHDAVRAMLAAIPGLVNAVGPHPYWGGRPQALHVAIETKRPEMVRLLLDHGADVDGSNDEYDHWSPLMLAVKQKLPDVRDELLARGARVGLSEALMLADDARVEALLAAGSLPDIAPNRGSILAFARTPFAIDRLIELGAPVDTTDRWGATPMEAMSRLGARGRPLVERLIARGVPARPSEYARMGDLAKLEALVAADHAVAREDAVMMAAVDFGHHDLARWLLERGGNPRARSEAGSRHTALHSAAWNGDLPMVELLLEAGADPTARDEQYDATPRGWAETSIEVTNNPACAAVAAHFAAAGR